MWTIFKVFIEFVTIFFLFVCLFVCFCFGLLTKRQMESHLPGRIWNLHPPHWKAVLTSGPPGKRLNGCL